MGIIIRQGFWGLSLVYVGVALGYISTLLVLPAFLDVEEIGLLRLIQSNGLMLAPLAAFGIPTTWLQISPKYSQDLKLRSQAFCLSLLSLLITNGLLLFAVFIYADNIKWYFEAKSSLYNNYLLISAFIFISQSFYETFAAVSQSYFKATLPVYFKEIHLRLTTLILVILYGYEYIELDFTLYCIGFNYILTSLILGVLIIVKNKLIPRWPKKFLNSFHLRSFFGLSSYFGLLAIGGSIIQYSGQLITASELGLEQNGILTTCVFIAAVIEMPRRVINQVSTPLITSYLETNNIEDLSNLNKKASLNMFLITGLIFLVIGFCLTDLFNTIPKGDTFNQGFYVVLLIGLGKTIGMTFGMNTEIFMYSNLKKWNILILGLSSIFMLTANFIFIDHYGIIGAAIAMTSTFLLTHLIRTFLIWRRFKISPFDVNQIKLLIPISITIGLMLLLALNFHPYLNILLKTFIISVIFLGICISLKISEEINNLYKKAIALIGLR